MRRLTLLLLLVLAAPAAAQTGGAKAVVGGGSFNTAPLLTPGAYTDTVAAGETVYWKINLKKGQALEVTANVDTSAIETDITSNNYDDGLDNLDYLLKLYTPLREQYADRLGEFPEAGVELKGDSGAGQVSGRAIGPKILGFEQVLGDEYSEDKFTAPGEAFVSLSAADNDIFPANVPAELPVSFELVVTGTPQASSPDFAKDLPSEDPDKPKPEEQNTNALIDAGATDEADPALTIGAVAAVALLAGLGLGGVVRRLTRRPAAAGGSGPAS